MSLSYWLDPLPSLRRPLEGEQRCDVLVIGAGLTGSSAAVHLSEAGLDVVLLEARSVAESASGRNAGFILQGTAERYDRAVALMGREDARAVHAWTTENHRRMAEFIERHALDCGYQRRGSLQLAEGPEEERSLERSAQLLQEDGFEAVLQQGEALPEIFQSAGYRMGIWLPGDGELDPAAFVRGAVSQAERQGARVAEGAPVLELDARSVGEVRARTPAATIHAQVAVVTTNARAGELLPELQQLIDPVRGQMLATEPLPPLFPCPVYANHGYDYWRQDPHGRVVLGGWRNLDPETERGHDEVTHQGIQERMTEYLRRYTGEGLRISHRWAGIMAFSRDGLPLVGAAPGSPGALVGAGFTGHGFGFGWMAGAALAEVVLEGRHPFSDRFSPRRFL